MHCVHCVHWPTIFMIHNIAVSDENDETLQAPETLDHGSSIPTGMQYKLNL